MVNESRLELDSSSSGYRVEASSCIIGWTFAKLTLAGAENATEKKTLSPRTEGNYTELGGIRDPIAITEGARDDSRRAANKVKR